MFTRWVLTLAAVGVAVVFVTGASAGTQARGSVTADLSTRSAALAYLASQGISQRGVVIQRGLRNYAGPSCPGAGWNCTTAKRVMQISTAAPATNQFVCTTSSAGPQTAPDCLIVQSSSSAANSATCTEKGGDPTGTQTCRIYQLNVSGANNATVLQQVAATSGSTQTATQATEISQWTTSGSNTAQVNQDLKESQSATVKTGSITQQQDGYQTAGVTQHSDTGNNAAQINQSLQLKLAATGGSSITQKQNTTATGYNQSGIIYQNADPDSLAWAELNGDPTGTNTGYLNQLNDLNASGTKTALLNQTQGAPTTGLFGDIDQLSTGISTGKTNQSEHQTLSVSQVPPGGITQTQYGPMWWDPEQGTNPLDTQLVAQSSDQHAGPTAYQRNEAQAFCETSGLCTVTQMVANDKQKATNSCSDSFCDIGVTAISNPGGEGGNSTSQCPGSSTDSGCTFPPYDHPTPPSELCEFFPAAPPCIELIATTTTVESSYNPSLVGDDVTFTATVAPVAATGTVTFMDGATVLGTVPLDGGSAAYEYIDIAPLGEHVITATYSGDSTYEGSSGSVSQFVEYIG